MPHIQLGDIAGTYGRAHSPNLVAIYYVIIVKLFIASEIHLAHPDPIDTQPHHQIPSKNDTATSIASDCQDCNGTYFLKPHAYVWSLTQMPMGILFISAGSGIKLSGSKT